MQQSPGLAFISLLPNWINASFRYKLHLILCNSLHDMRTLLLLNCQGSFIARQKNGSQLELGVGFHLQLYDLGYYF